MHDIGYINFTDSFYDLNLQYPSNWTKVYPEECRDPHGCTIDTGGAMWDQLIISFDIFNDSKKSTEDLAIYGDILYHGKNSKDAMMDIYSDIYLKRYLEPLKLRNHTLIVLMQNNTIIAGHTFWIIEFYDNYQNLLTVNKHMLTIKDGGNDYSFGFKVKYSATDVNEYSRYLPSVQGMINSIVFTEK